MSNLIDFSDFLKVDIRIGTVLSAAPNAKARKPAFVLEVDFGELGIKTTSAQITENYQPQNLVGEQVVAVVNFPVKVVAGIKSEVLILAVVCDGCGTVLLQPKGNVQNGAKVL